MIEEAGSGPGSCEGGVPGLVGKFGSGVDGEGDEVERRPVWMAPVLQGLFRVTVISADCGHVYGLLVRYCLTAGLDEVRYAWVPIREASFYARATASGCPGGGPL